MFTSDIIAYSCDRVVLLGAGLTISISFDKFFFTLSDDRRAGAFCFQQSLIIFTTDSRTLEENEQRKSSVKICSYIGHIYIKVWARDESEK